MDDLLRDGRIQPYCTGVITVDNLVLGETMNDEEPKYEKYDKTDDDLIGAVWTIAIGLVLMLIIFAIIIVTRVL